MTGHEHDRETCGCPLIDFPEQVIPGQLDALDAIAEAVDDDQRDR